MKCWFYRLFCFISSINTSTFPPFYFCQFLGFSFSKFLFLCNLMMLMIQPHWHLPPDPHVKERGLFFFRFNEIVQQFFFLFQEETPRYVFVVLDFEWKLRVSSLLESFPGSRIYMTVVQSSGTASAAMSNNGRSRTSSPPGGHAHLILHISLRTRGTALLSCTVLRIKTDGAVWTADVSTSLLTIKVTWEGLASACVHTLHAAHVYGANTCSVMHRK